MRVLQPGEEAYDAARVTFNGLVDRKPALILQCESTDEVREAILRGRDLGLPIAVRGGGHSVAGHSVCEGGVVVDLRLLNGVTLDTDSRRATVQGGATWRDVDPATAAHGLATPGGTFDTTGVGGLTLGGGIGYLIGAHGLTCDNLIGAEVVTADGDVLRASANDDDELFWALRGGGGNFGVVTSFEFALHPVETIQGGLLVCPISHAAEALRLFRDTMTSAPRELTVMADMGFAQALDQRVVVLFVCHTGSSARARRTIERLRSELPVLHDGLGQIPYLTLQQATPEFPFGLRHYWKGHFLRDLPDELLDLAVASYAERPARSRDSVLFEPIHGAALDVEDEASAFGHRAARWNVSPMAIWEHAVHDADEIAWARSLASALEPWSVRGGGYLNYGAPDESADRVAAAYAPAQLERLRAVKRRLDPENVFRFNANIRP
jgi:FAD/FMN-containing dehydrogenase